MRVGLLRAPNPGLFTGEGTNTWIIEADGHAVVVDPGPMIPDHVTTIRLTLEDVEPVGVLVTHAHPDHAPAANPLADALGVPAYGCGPGPGFQPDIELADGQAVNLGSIEVTAVHTPGHTADHLCFLLDSGLFSGDHIMGGATVIVEHMTEYMESLHRLQAMDLDVIYPGHGPVIKDPQAVLDYYVAHRVERERQILDAIRGGAGTLGGIVAAVYTDVDPALHFAAGQSVGAHLRKLAGEGLVEIMRGADDWTAPVRAVPPGDTG
jgi:glyoxylase-like metal-dependent hydrolase (beta-lactamase superfamily II)